MIIQANRAGIFNAPVVALHSSASNGLQWKQFEDALAGRFEVSAPNLPGYGGEAPALASCDAGLASSAEPIIRHIVAFGQPVHLVGHSMGASVAIKIALQRPDLIKSLTLYEPAAFHFLRSGNQLEQSLFEEISGISEAVRDGQLTGNPAQGMQTFIDFWNEPGTWDAMPERTRDSLAAMAPSIISDFTRGFSETWTLSDLSHLSMPVLMLMGMESPEVAQHVAGRIADAIPTSRLALLPGLGHMAPVFEPDWVNPRIYEHIVNAERPTVNCFWPQLSAA